MATSDLTTGQLQQIVEQAQNGSTEAFGRLYDHFADAVYRYSAFRVSPTAAEDLTSEIFLKAWEKLHTYQPRPNVPFAAWLFRIARHTVIDAYREQHQIMEVPEEYPDEDDLNRASTAVKRNHLVKTVRESVQQLPRRYREILELSFLADLPHDEVARILGLSDGGMRVLKFRALKKLEQILPAELRENPAIDALDE